MNTTVYASDYAKLDSDVYNGGGTDDTAALQAILDKAVEWGRLKLVMDGAALVRGLRVHGNTTIECMNKGCGFYLADNSNCSVIRNANQSYGEIVDKNISLIGGTYNHNCLHQEHHVATDEPSMDQSTVPEQYRSDVNVRWSIAVELIGVENLTVRDLTVRDQRTFAFTVGNFRHVVIENTFIDLAHEIPGGNQDGFHFWGPGQYLTIRNVGGRTEDDFMNIGPDERDAVSSITDVMIDGVFLDDAWQGIRLLSRGMGLLDRVTVRNITGTYRSYGFYINPWFIDKTNGNFGNITFENINLKPIRNLIPEVMPGYPNQAFLFSIGGDIDALTLRNIQWYHPNDNRSVFELGMPYHDVNCPFVKTPRIKSFTVDGLQITETTDSAKDTEYITVRGIIDRLILRDVDIVRDGEEKGCCLLRTRSDAQIRRLMLDRAVIENVDTVFDFSEGVVDRVFVNNTFVTEGTTEMVGHGEKPDVGDFKTI